MKTGEGDWNGLPHGRETVFGKTLIYTTRLRSREWSHVSLDYIFLDLFSSSLLGQISRTSTRSVSPAVVEDVCASVQNVTRTIRDILLIEAGARWAQVYILYIHQR